MMYQGPHKRRAKTLEKPSITFARILQDPQGFGEDFTVQDP